ncbi:hypothetical protein ACG7TL_005021 [Trametes sanguinea]
MIRRPPTQIPMTDMDVQQVRDALEQQQKAALAAATAQQGTPATPAQSVVAPTMPYHHVEEAKKKREAMSREQRLGL